VRNHVPSWENSQEKGFQTLSYSNIFNTTNIYVFIPLTGVEGRTPEYQEPRDLRSNPFERGGDDAILPPPPQGYWIEDSKRIVLELLKKALGFS